MSAKTVEQIMERVKALPEPAQINMLHSLDLLATKPAAGPLAQFAGTMDSRTADEMEAAIEVCCEQVNPNDWPPLP
jgi:hypothetical protein